MNYCKRFAAALMLLCTSVSTVLATPPIPPIKPNLSPQIKQFLELDYQNGGLVEAFFERIDYYRTNRVMVIIDENGCRSSCTLLTTLLEDNLICALPGAQFVFHKFMRVHDRKVNDKGQMIDYKLGEPGSESEMTKVMNSYPKQVKEIIGYHGENLPPWGEEMFVDPGDIGVPECHFRKLANVEE